MPISTHLIEYIDKLAHQYDVSPDRLVLKVIFYAIEPKSPEEKIREIEKKAITEGWTKEQLWNKHPRPDLKGLIEFLDEYIEIVEVTKEHISLLHLDSGVINKIYNMQVKQQGITTIQKETAMPMITVEDIQKAREKIRDTYKQILGKELKITQ